MSDPLSDFFDGPDAPEVPLPRGDVTEGVVRIGDTVRRPHQPQSDSVAGYLAHLQKVGFDGSPRYLGRDRRGRDVLTYLDGAVAGDPPDPWAADAVWRRDLVVLDPPIEGPAPELVSHLDVTPQNVVVNDGAATGLIDFDLAGPTTRLIDVYNTAMHWVPLRPAADVWPTWPGIDRLARLRRFADAYGLTADERAAFPDTGIAGADRSWRRMQAAAEQLGGGWGPHVARRRGRRHPPPPAVAGGSPHRTAGHAPGRPQVADAAQSQVQSAGRISGNDASPMIVRPSSLMALSRAGWFGSG